MNNPLKALSKKEWFIWISSVVVVLFSNIMSANFDVLTLFATLIGVTALIFASKGNVFAQILIILFSILYGIISFRFHYWGEMITYLGMTLPMAIWSAITWMKNPSEENNGEVQIQQLNSKQFARLGIISVPVTLLFYFVLKSLNTPNIMFSTISVLTSFLAATLTMLRSSYYAVMYALNDIVLVVLWIMASLKNPVYIPMVVNFAIFLVNDLYGFVCWKKRELQQAL